MKANSRVKKRIKSCFQYLLQGQQQQQNNKQQLLFCLRCHIEKNVVLIRVRSDICRSDNLYLEEYLSFKYIL